MTKTVIRSPLDRLPLHQKQMILAWLTTGGADHTGIPYAQAAKRLDAEYGIKTSTGSLHGFYHRHLKGQAPATTTTFDPVARTLTIVIHLNR